MDLRQIQYFLCLYEEKSVTKAAKRLNIVQPALSMQISRLESEIGRELFTRTPRGMHSTPAADEMYSLFVPVVSAFASAKAKVTHDGKSLSGHVRIGLISSIGHSVLPSVLTQFTESYPNITLSITEGLTDPLCEDVNHGRIDLAFVNRPRGHSSLAQELVLREEIVLMSSARSGEKLPAKMQLKEVVKHRLILPTRDHGLRHVLEDYAKKLGITLAPVFELDSLLAKSLLISQGPYVGFLPESVIQNLRNRTAVHFRTHRLESPSLYRDLVYVFNPQRAPSAAAQAFAQALGNRMRLTHEQSLGSVIELRRAQGKPEDPIQSVLEVDEDSLA
ncbi:LysR family transcriptional regulator [Orrella daihaiensis]|uniref:LysR family transcriptional regulator n=1 Tax=Orrella daihaiensis TaxID=2782176 RepID=A0ABY4AK08_9BURK|nr:LysR family transcriptional regulator [Orrella daihaiensis]UOD50623.1 LysR family transcriptional regulator [Orrella daihaiensis]